MPSRFLLPIADARLASRARTGPNLCRAALILIALVSSPHQLAADSTRPAIVIRGGCAIRGSGMGWPEAGAGGTTQGCAAAGSSQHKESADKEEEEEMSDETVLGEGNAEKLEDEYVHKVYDVIAPHFSHTRHNPWPKVSAFLNGLEDGSLVADVGCGNGKYMGVNKKLFMSGSDRSPELLKLCAEHSLEVHVADNMQLPYRSGVCDAAISIAVIHHMSNKERRIEAIKELLRIVRIGGKVLVYVWAMEQDGRRKGFDTQDQLVPWHLSMRFRAEPVLHGKVDTAKKSVVYKRFYHLFVEGELEGLVSSVGGCEIIDRYYDHENWVVVLEKTRN